MAANAAVIRYETTPLGGDFWRYDYTLEGIAPAGGFDGLTVYFEPTSFGQLTNAIAPLGWDPLVVQTDIGISADGFFDLLNLGGLLNGDLSPVEFSINAEYIGAGAQASQRFELYRSTLFEVVSFGETGQSNSVPEPGTGALVILAMGGVLLSRILRSAPAGYSIASQPPPCIVTESKNPDHQAQYAAPSAP